MHINQNQNQKFILICLILVLITFAWLFRWDIKAGAGTNGSATTIHHKLDRWSGESYICHLSSNDGCD
jgi:hypothetical protein